MSRRMDMIASMVFCFQLFLRMKDTQGERLVRLKRYVGKLGNLQYSVSGRADFLAVMARTSGAATERYATSHPKKNKRMVRFVL